MSHGDTLSLHAYCDVDYIGDITDRKSCTRALILLNSHPLIWGSHKQAYVARSTTEVECIVGASITKDVVWIHRLLADFGSP